MLRRNLPRRNPSEFRQNTTPDYYLLAQNLYRLQMFFITSGFLGFAAICRDVHFVDSRTAAFAAGRRPTRWIAPPLFDSDDTESESDLLKLFFAREARTRERSALLLPYEDDDGQRSCDHSSVQYRRRRWGTTIATSVDTESEIASVPDFSRQRRQRRATMKPNFLLTSAETIRQLSSVSIHPDRIRG